MKTIYLLVFTILLFSYTSCEKDNPTGLGEIEGIVRDYTGLDGCGFIIELMNGEKLEPVEVTDTNFVFMDGQRVAVTYTELTDMGSYCMVGKVVRIETIRLTSCTPFNHAIPGKLPKDSFCWVCCKSFEPLLFGALKSLLSEDLMILKTF